MFRRIHCCLLLLLGFLGSEGTAVPATPIRYAENFTIEDHGDHRVITVRNTTREAERSYRYALVPSGVSDFKPEGFDAVIRTPVRRAVAMETVTIGQLDALDRIDSLVAAATTDFITHDGVQRGLREGRIQPLQTGPALDVERLLLLQPDLIVTSTIGDPGFDLPARLARTGLPVVIAADYMERHPLARAEWIKFIAAFYDLDEEAEAIFRTVEARYRRLASVGAAVEDRPTVLCGAPYSGVWHVPGGDSYTAQLIEDAGGHYLWRADRSQGGIPLDTERVFLRAAGADFWIHPSFYRSRTALLGADARFDRFAAAARGAVYNNTRQVGPGGGNPIWERGTVRPDEVLADLIHIFHPELLPEHELIYYERLAE